MPAPPSHVHFLVVAADGRILGNGQASPQSFPWWEPPEGGTLAVVDADTVAAVMRDRDGWRLQGGVPVERAAMAVSVSKAAIAADGVDAASLSGFPAGSVLRITGAVELGPVELAAGGDADPLEVTSTRAGAILVELRRDPTHKPWRGTIHAAV